MAAQPAGAPDRVERNAESASQALKDLERFTTADFGIEPDALLAAGVAMIVVCDDSVFMADDFSNFVWATFTRSNPSHDVHGIGATTMHKHWGCAGPLVIDARVKPWHAPELVPDAAVGARVGERFPNI